MASMLCPCFFFCFMILLFIRFFFTLLFPKSFVCLFIFCSSNTAQEIFSIKDIFRKCDQICSFLRIWSNLQKKSLIETSFFVKCNYLLQYQNFCIDQGYVVELMIARMLACELLHIYTNIRTS